MSWLAIAYIAGLLTTPAAFIIGAVVYAVFMHARHASAIKRTGRIPDNG
jgi:hypothetical protein